ncbi:MAG TPA: translation elongation factor Ts [Elusimicrobiales bacterium]|nr:translation elongation factor Ts [Elusimicrobiales bacterium]
MSVVIKSEQVMTLRSRTGAGIMDCKSALNEAQGDLEKAVELLRKKGLAGLAKRAGREMKEGLVAVKTSADGARIAMVEINCETDFVAKNQDVLALADGLCSAMLEKPDYGNPAENADAKERLQAVAMKSGENMAIRRGVVYGSAGTVANYYLHSDSRKACLVELGFAGDPAKARGGLASLAKEIAMQAVAMGPKYLRREDVPAEVVAKEREIYKAKTVQDEEAAKARAAETGKPYRPKPPEALEKMLEGRVNKFYQEICLLEQVSIRDSKKTVTQFVKDSEGALGGAITVKRFDCYLVGVE